MGVFGLQASVDHRSANHPLVHARRTSAGHNNISESGIEETWDNASFDFPFVGANSLVSGRVLLTSCTLIKDGINKLNFRPMM